MMQSWDYGAGFIRPNILPLDSGTKKKYAVACIFPYNLEKRHLYTAFEIVVDSVVSGYR